jgi:cytochrome c oxidase cbb3-type subunit 1
MALPVALMFLSSTAWLVVSAVLALITSVKLHSSTFIAGCSWLTYGHTRAAANDTFVYGFATQAGLAVMLWILCRAGATRIVGSLSVSIAALFLNLGVALGTAGILRGDTTGFEWLEFPTYGSATFLAGYLVIAVCAMLTFARRTTNTLQPAQWYILAGLLWFPWLYTTARLLLVWFPVRGAMQFLVNNWFASGLFTLWLGAIGLAVVFHFLTEMSGGRLHSRAMAALGFWTVAVCGPVGGLYAGVPLPSWIIGLSVGGTIVLLAVVIANALVLWRTSRAPASECSRIWFTAALVFYAVSALLNIMVALCPVSRLTLVSEAVQMFACFGFVGFALIGAILHILPRVFGGGLSCGSRGKLTWWCLMLGVLIFAVPMLVGGLAQGRKLMDGSVPFTEVMNATKPFIRISTLGLVLLVVASIATFGNVFKMLRECCRNCCCAGKQSGETELKPARSAR